MYSQPLLRLIGVPLTIIALACAFAAPAVAGGGGSPTGPTAQLSPPSLTLDGQGGVIVTTTLFCWGDAVTDGHVSVTVSLGQQRASGGAWLETTCAAAPQQLTLPVVSVTDHAFHPGPISGIFEFEVVTATSAGQGIGEIDGILRPVQMGR